jgi:lipopolysaccharide export system protein LptC
MERFTAGFPLALLALLAALTFWLDRIAQPTTTPRDGNMRHDPDYIVENFVAVSTRVDGTPRYQLKAKRMRHYPDDDTTHLENPSILSFDGKHPETTIVADTALMSAEGKTIDFNGNVITNRAASRTRKGMVLTTEHLHVIPDDEIARTDSPVSLVEANTKLTAVGLELNNKSKTIRLKSKVRGSYVQPKK